MDRTTAPAGSLRGDADISQIGALLADRARCRMLMALNDGRALPSGVLAAEAGVSRSTASSHLGKLTDADLVRVETHGRFRYYRLSGPHVGQLLEQLTLLSSAAPVKSLREGSAAARLRVARTCYDHLAGRLGVSVMAAMLDHGYLEGGDGQFRPEEARRDRLSGYGWDVEYCLTESGWGFLDTVGVKIPPGNRSLIRYCVDWSEQRHHLAGMLGRAVQERFLDAGWIIRKSAGRAVQVTPDGRGALAEYFDVAWA